jgi:uncharacterized protein (DUF2147 family)
MKTVIMRGVPSITTEKELAFKKRNVLHTVSKRPDRKLRPYVTDIQNNHTYAYNIQIRCATESLTDDHSRSTCHELDPFYRTGRFVVSSLQ